MTLNTRVALSAVTTAASIVMILKPTSAVSRERAIVGSVAGVINTVLLAIGK